MHQCGRQSSDRNSRPQLGTQRSCRKSRKVTESNGKSRPEFENLKKWRKSRGKYRPSTCIT